MVELEGHPDDKELVDKMFRACHTVKGMAGMMNLPAITDTSHALEDLLGAVRDGKLKPTGAVADAIYSGIDALESMVADLERSGSVAQVPGIIDELKSALTVTPKPAKREEKKEKAAPPPPQPAKRTSTVKIKFSRKCSLPAARSMVILKELEKGAAVVSTEPSEDEIEQEKVFELLTVELEPGEKLNESIDRVLAMTDVDELVIGETGTPPESWRKHSKPETVKPLQEVALVQTVKVGMDKLDDLLDNVGELVISRSRLMEKASTGDDLELAEISSLIDKLTSDIQSQVLSIRMIPLEVVMSRFPRMVRDMSKAQGKEIELIVEGGNIELDRTVVDRISDPLMHIIRNCIDHGIEEPEARAKASKKPHGTIRVVASKQQDHVLIEISDDGRGIDYDVVRKAAVSKGAMTKEQADAALGRQLLELLFKPGFSTKTEVTEVSGRGVGLDVVRRSVEELGGTVMINTSKGAGTTFSLWLPFTLAIIDAMLVSIAGQMYAVPMSVVVESHRYEKPEIRMIRNREVVQLRGEVLPMIRMRDFFGIGREEGNGAVDVLIVQSRERRAAIAVDDLMGHQQIVVKPLDQRLRKTRGISGGTILGSGGIALILDADSILGG